MNPYESPRDEIVLAEAVSSNEQSDVEAAAVGFLTAAIVLISVTALLIWTCNGSPLPF